MEKLLYLLTLHRGMASLIAYEELRLQYVAFEIDDYYYNLSKERLDRETAQMNLFDFMGG